MTIARPRIAADLRSWLALGFFVVTYVAFDRVEEAIHHPLAQTLGLHMIQAGAMAPVPYGVLMIVRLALDVACAILAIVALGSAHVSPSHQSAGSASLHGGGWLAFDFVGAMGEELAGRVAVLLVAQPLIGRRGAILASGVLFAGIHLGNPGVTGVWLTRLFLQGLLLAYAVYRTGSFWWSTGYHTGWNWASAPLFGAAGSGYLNQGHLFDFMPTGADWITGGAVGPEGSVFAFVAMLAALGLLILMPGKMTGGEDTARATQN